MAKSNNVVFHVQIPADAHALVQLLYKLGIIPGPIKAVQMQANSQVNIWFASAFMPTKKTIKRVTARLVDSTKKTSSGGYRLRRVYMDVRVQMCDEEWREIKNEFYVRAGMMQPWQYYGKSYIGIYHKQEFSEAYCYDSGDTTPRHADEVVTYHRLLEGDRDYAIAEAEQRVAKLNQS